MGNKAGAFKRTLTFTCDSSNPQGKRNNREEVEADFSIMGCDEIKVSVGPGLPMNSSKFKTSVQEAMESPTFPNIIEKKLKLYKLNNKIE